jgi:hypothetical protein
MLNIFCIFFATFFSREMVVKALYAHMNNKRKMKKKKEILG